MSVTVFNDPVKWFASKIRASAPTALLMMIAHPRRELTSAISLRSPISYCILHRWSSLKAEFILRQQQQQQHSKQKRINAWGYVEWWAAAARSRCAARHLHHQQQQKGPGCNGRDQVEKLYPTEAAALILSPAARLWTKFKWRDKFCDAMIIPFKFLSYSFSFSSFRLVFFLTRNQKASQVVSYL